MTHTVRAEVQQRARQQRSGTLDMFAPDVQYHENRYQQLSNENRKRAKASTWQLIQTTGVVPYEDCWAEALQFSCVYEKDLRQWISEWEQHALIEVDGRLRFREILKVNCGHRIRWLRPSV
jgi:hypothetical protein